MEKIRDRVISLLRDMGENVYEKDEAIALSLLSAVAGESIFLLGPPGVAKSMVARRLGMAFQANRPFEYLMSRFSTPDEIFGPVSISGLKEKDVYERSTEGYLPSATVAFLDEIWKAGPSIQNALLAILNERVFRNGANEIRVPLKAFVAASNELPAESQGLEALWDRFLVRVMVGPIEDMALFDSMILSEDPSKMPSVSRHSFSDEELDECKKGISEVKVPYIVLEIIHRFRDLVSQENQKMESDGETGRPIYISDRRWRKIIHLLRASAYLSGRKEVRIADVMLIASCSWSEIEHISKVENILRDAVIQSLQSYGMNISSIEGGLEELRQQQSSYNSLNENDDSSLEVVDSFFYEIEDAMKERLLIYISDYQSISPQGDFFVLQRDKYRTDTYVLKKYNATIHFSVRREKLYTLRRQPQSVQIKEKVFPLLRRTMPDIGSRRVSLDGFEKRYDSVSEQLEASFGTMSELIATEEVEARNHLFISGRQKAALASIFSGQQRQMDRYRLDLQELRDAYRREKEQYPS